MDGADSLLYLIEEIRTKITGLEKAVDDIHHVKKSLKVASFDVKAQIRDSISRHLEALRNREIWLLSQVELIQQGKEEVLLQKQTEIIDMIGGLKKVCALLEQSVEEEKLGEVEMFEAQLSELLTSVEKMNISPEETSNICFKAHNLELLESIRGFGHIGGEASTDQTHLASLFNGINLAGVNSTPPSNKRKFFTSGPSGSMQTWLLHGERMQKNQSVPATSVSVEKWLTKCNPYSGSDAASEMEGSVKSFDLSELKWTLVAETNQLPSGQDTFGGYFEEVKNSTLENWIKACPNLPEQPKSKLIGDTYSKIVAMGNENWLLYKQEKSNLRNFPENLGKIHRQEGSNLKWLRRSKSYEYLPQTSTGKAFTNIANTSMDQWLQPKVSLFTSGQCNGKSSCADCDCASTKDDSLDYSDLMSDADWLKVKEEDVVSIENLDSFFKFKSRKSTQEDNNWLAALSVKPYATEEDRSGIRKYGQMLQAQPNEDWLHSTRTTNKGKENVQPNFMQGFLESQPNDYNKWLSKPITNSLSADTCKWLARSSLDRCKNCPKMCSKGLFTLFDDMKDASNDDWLKKSNQ